jgi:hypothetical protein
MSHVTAIEHVPNQSRYFGPGRVLEVDIDDRRAQLALENEPGATPIWAQVALPDVGCIDAGSSVLVMGDSLDALFVVGVLASASTQTRHLALANGTYVEVSGDAEAEVLQVFSKTRQLVFEYDATRDVARLNLESGDLELCAENGNIVLDAARDIRMNAGTVDVTANHRVRVGVADGVGVEPAGLFVTGKRVDLKSQFLGVQAQRGDLQVPEMQYVGRSLVARLGRVQLVAKRLETIAETVIEKAKNTYRSVDELVQLTAGRVRTLVDSTFHLKSKRVYLRAKKDVKIDGDRIHLG